MAVFLNRDLAFTAPELMVMTHECCRLEKFTHPRFGRETLRRGHPFRLTRASSTSYYES
jgi:hypothetical protein